MENDLKEITSAIGRCMLLITMQLVKRSVKRDHLVEVVEKLKFSIAKVERLIAKIDQQRKNKKLN